MAALESPQWHAVTQRLREVLVLLNPQPFLGRFYLAGGTALALQIGHRRSVDLDFFSENDEVSAATRQEIIQALSPSGAQVIENVDGNLLMLVNGIQIGFFSYAYPLVAEPQHLGQIALASLADIGLMKCDALFTRGSRKDFYDLYFIAKRIAMEDLLALGETKYAYYRDFPFAVLERMIQFDQADLNVPPQLFEDVPWPMVKDFFIQEARRLGRAWLGGE